MKQAIYLAPVHKEMMKTAMRYHRQLLKDSRRQLFDIGYQKVNNSDVKVELDGMEMICICQSLFIYAKSLTKHKKYAESKNYRGIAQQLEVIRIQFQQENGPKIRKEKAASAGTLTA